MSGKWTANQQPHQRMQTKPASKQAKQHHDAYSERTNPRDSGSQLGGQPARWAARELGNTATDSKLSVFNTPTPIPGPVLSFLLPLGIMYNSHGDSLKEFSQKRSVDTSPGLLT